MFNFFYALLGVNILFWFRIPPENQKFPLIPCVSVTLDHMQNCLEYPWPLIGISDTNMQGMILIECTTINFVFNIVK